MALLLGAMSPSAEAHFERPVRVPSPAPDRSISPAAGGKVPARRERGRTLVVCRRDSLARARRGGASGRLLARNRRLRRRCRFRSIQAAVTARATDTASSWLPGVYREHRSRRQPTFDRRCARYRVRSEEQAGTEQAQALSYA